MRRRIAILSLGLGFACFAALADEPRPAPVVCAPGGRGYELRLIEITPTASLGDRAQVVVPIPSPWLDAAALQALATRFGGEKPAALGWGFLISAPPSAALDVSGHVPGRGNERFEFHVPAAGEEPGEHAPVLERASLRKADRALTIALADGEARAFVVADGKRRRVIGTLVAGPCDADGLTGKAAGPCAVRDRAGFEPAAALPSKDKAGGPMLDFTRRVDGSILVRFVVTRDGRVVDPLLVLDGKASESTSTGPLPLLVRDRYEAAKVNGEPVASCRVIEILRSTFTQPVLIYETEGCPSDSGGLSNALSTSPTVTCRHDSRRESASLSPSGRTPVRGVRTRRGGRVTDQDERRPVDRRLGDRPPRPVTQRAAAQRNDRVELGLPQRVCRIPSLDLQRTLKPDHDVVPHDVGDAPERDDEARCAGVQEGARETAHAVATDGAQPGLTAGEHDEVGIERDLEHLVRGQPPVAPRVVSAVVRHPSPAVPQRARGSWRAGHPPGSPRGPRCARSSAPGRGRARDPRGPRNR